MSVASAQLGLQLAPLVPAVLDKRTFGTEGTRPSVNHTGTGLLRYETAGSDASWPKWVYYNGTAWIDFAGGVDLSNQTQFAHGIEATRPLASAVYKGFLRHETAGSDASWPKWVYSDGTSWNTLSVDAGSASFQNPSLSSTDYVQNAIGDIGMGVTASSLEAYPSLSAIISAMLRVGPSPEVMPVPINYGFEYEPDPSTSPLYSIVSGVPPVTYNIASNSTMTITGKFVADRGEWSPKETSGSAMPYGRPRAMTLNNPFDGLLIRVDAPPDATGRIYKYDVAIPLTTSNVLSTWTISNGIAYFWDDEPAYNNKGNVIPRTVRRGILPQDVVFRNYAPVYLRDTTLRPNDKPRNSSQSNLDATPVVFADTTEVIIVGHEYDKTILVPKSNSSSIRVHQFEKAMFDAFLELDTDVTVITAETLDLNDGTMLYYSISFPQYRPARDIKLTYVA